MSRTTRRPLRRFAASFNLSPTNNETIGFAEIREAGGLLFHHASKNYGL